MTRLDSGAPRETGRTHTGSLIHADFVKQIRRLKKGRTVFLNLSVELAESGGNIFVGDTVILRDIETGETFSCRVEKTTVGEEPGNIGIDVKAKVSSLLDSMEWHE